MRVGQKAHVEHQVGIAQLAVLEAEALERDRQAAGRARREQFVRQLAPEHRGAQPGCVDHDIRAHAQRRERAGLPTDPLEHAAGRGQGVAAPGLLVPGEQRLLVGLQEQDAMGHAGGPETVEHARQARKVTAAAHVGHHRRPGDLRTGVHEELDQRADHLRGEVVHAEVALILEHRHRRRFAGPAEPGDHHEIRERQALVGIRGLGRGLRPVRIRVVERTRCGGLGHHPAILTGGADRRRAGPWRCATIGRCGAARRSSGSCAPSSWRVPWGPELRPPPAPTSGRSRSRSAEAHSAPRSPPGSSPSPSSTARCTSTPAATPPT